MDGAFLLKLIVTLLTFALAAIEFDFFNKFDKNPKTKKKWLIFIFGALILFTVWDTTKDSIDNSKAEEKRDSLITVDSIRAANIVTNLGINLDSIAETRKEIFVVDSILHSVRDTLQSQVDLLNLAVEKSREVVRLGKQRLSQDSPELAIFDSSIQILPNAKDSTHFSIHYDTNNVGIRSASNLKYTHRILLFNETSNHIKLINLNTNISIFPSNISPRTKGITTLNFDISKEELFNDFDKLILIIQCQYNDLLTGDTLEYKGQFIIEELGLDKQEFLLLTDDNLVDKINNILIKNNKAKLLY